MGRDAEQISNSKNQNAKLGIPTCPAGHFALGTPKIVTILKWQFQRYDIFCFHCDRRYIVYRWKWLADKVWKLWRYKTFPGTDNYTTAFKPPAEAVENLKFNI
jgi:hypothetical protein